MQSSFTGSRHIPQDILGMSCMLLMAQAYGFAPLQPTLRADFGSPLVALAVPAFAFALALSAAVIAWFYRRLALTRCFYFSLIGLFAGAMALSLVNDAEIFLLVRVATGACTGMMLPAAMMLAVKGGRGKDRMTNLVIVVFALGAGMTFGPSLGGWLNDLIGWRSLYQFFGLMAAFILVYHYFRTADTEVGDDKEQSLRAVSPPVDLWKNRYKYAFIYITAVFHSGVFVWISVYFATRYHLTEYQIANELILFGLPGLVVTFLMFSCRLDGKVLLILYSGLGATIGGVLILRTDLPLGLAQCLLVVISIGFSCSQPIFIGILKTPSTVRPVAIGCAILFAGYGSGPIIMSILLEATWDITALFLLVLVCLMLFISRRIWRVTIAVRQRRVHHHRPIVQTDIAAKASV